MVGFELDQVSQLQICENAYKNRNLAKLAKFLRTSMRLRIEVGTRIFNEQGNLMFAKRSFEERRYQAGAW